MRIRARGIALIVSEEVDGESAAFDTLIARHSEAMAPFPKHMIELEFLDDPAPDRFLRFGTCPELMTEPRQIDLTDRTTAAASVRAVLREQVLRDHGFARPAKKGPRGAH